MKRLSHTPCGIIMKGFFLFLLLSTQFTLHAQWEFVGSPEKLVFGWPFSSDGDTIYVGSGGGLYFTIDKGATWHSIPDNTPFIEVTSHFINDDRIYVMADSYGKSEQLFVSEDKGNTWERLSMYDHYPGHINTYSIKGDTIVLVTFSKGMVSFDNGKTEAFSFETDSIGRISRAFWLGNTLMGISSDQNVYKLWRSYDAGLTWLPSTNPGQQKFIVVGENLWAYSLDTSTLIHTYFRSQDEGLTWSSQLTLQGVGLEEYVVNITGDSETVIVTHYIHTASKIYISSDDGDNWLEMDADLSRDKWSPSLVGDRLFVFADDSISTSIDFAQTWHASNAGFKDARIGDLVLPSDDVYWMESTYSMDGAQTWLKRPSQLHRFASSGDGHMLSIRLEKVYRSLDAGLTWTFLRNMPFDIEVGGARIYYLNGKYIVGNGGGLYSISENGGDTWSSVFDVGGRLYDVGFHEGKYYAEQGHRTIVSDDFRNWEDYTYNLNLSPYGGLVLHEETLLSFNGRMYRLDLNTLSWQLSPYVNDEQYLPNNYPVVEHMISYGDAIIAACNGLGVFISHNTGLSWEPFNDGLDNLRAYRIFYDDKYLYAGMKSGGIWRRPLTDLDHYTIIEGTTFLDKNKNGIKDTAEFILPRITISSTNSDAFVQSRNDGTFTLYTNVAGQDTIEAIPPHSFAEITTPPVEVSGSTDSLYFGVFMDDYFDLAVDITNITPARPGFDLCIQVSVTNSFTLSNEARVVLYPDASVLFTSSQVIPDFVTVDSIVWDLGVINPGELRHFNVCFYVPANIDINELIFFKAHVYPFESDIVPVNNISRLDLVIVGAYDPNDKAVFPAEPVTTEMIADTAQLTYTIRFQNLGTYRADIVRIVDTLSEALDLRSLQIISSSHEMTWRIRTGRILEILFDPIILPHSSADEQGSHGFVKYTINAKTDLTPEDKITNQAHIYFDYNVPVATNIVESLIKEIIVNTDEHGWNDASACPLSINPNPSNDFIEILAPQFISGTVSVIDQKGRLVMSTKISDMEKANLDIKALPAGLFTVVVSDSKQRCAGSFIKN